MSFTNPFRVVTPLLLLQVLPFSSPKWLLLILILGEVNSLYPGSPFTTPCLESPRFVILSVPGLQSGIFLFMEKIRTLKETGFRRLLLKVTCSSQVLAATLASK